MAQVRSGRALTVSVELLVRFIPTITFPADDSTAFDFNVSDPNLEELLSELVAVEAAGLALIRDNEIPPALLARKQDLYSQVSSCYCYTSTNITRDHRYSDSYYTIHGGSFQIVTPESQFFRL
jgi:hypothetical protein